MLEEPFPKIVPMEKLDILLYYMSGSQLPNIYNESFNFFALSEMFKVVETIRFFSNVMLLLLLKNC